MKRMPTSVYKELHVLRDKYGENEYHRDELLPAAMALIGKHLDDGKELVRAGWHGPEGPAQGRVGDLRPARPTH